MLEKTATSSSTAAGASAEDVDSVGDSSGSATAQALNFSSGNPRIEEITGVMHLFRNDAASSSDELPVSLIDHLIEFDNVDKEILVEPNCRLLC